MIKLGEHLRPVCRIRTRPATTATTNSTRPTTASRHRDAARPGSSDPPEACVGPRSGSVVGTVCGASGGIAAEPSRASCASAAAGSTPAVGSPTPGSCGPALGGDGGGPKGVPAVETGAPARGSSACWRIYREISSTLKGGGAWAVMSGAGGGCCAALVLGVAEGGGFSGLGWGNGGIYGTRSPGVTP